MKLLTVVMLTVLFVFAGGALFVRSGIYDVAADAPHSRPVHALLQSLRENSIARHAGRLEVPDLTDDELIRSGSGNYDAMCKSCHLAPGIAESELSKGLYPAPPPLAKTRIKDPSRAFWVIKHGIKASGMPAWGRSMQDEYIWGVVAFLRKLPELDTESYRALVASSGGHSHGGGETIEEETEGSGSARESADADVHAHADGRTHVHAPKQKPASEGTRQER